MKIKKIGERSKKKNSGKKAKEKLHENEERTRAIIEGTPHLFFYTQDAEANTTYVSPTIEHITGYKTDVWLKRGDWFITDATMNQIAKERTHANLQGEFTEEPILLEIHHASGHRILLEIYEYPITKNGRIVGLQGVAHDITQHKLEESQKEAALEMLQESEERYRQLMELSPDAITVHSEGKIVFVNPAAVKLMGAQCAEELLKKSTLEMVHPDFRSIATERIRQSIKQGGLALPYPEKFIRVDGSVVYVEVSALPIIYNGKQAMQVIARDITERKRAEEEIKMLATALKKINECVSITDIENTILFVNEAFLKTYGYSEQELIGQNIKIVRSPNSPQKVFEEVLPGTLSGGWTGELVNRRKDGSEFPIFLSTTVVEKKDGKPNSLIGIAIDITERKRVESQIKEALETLRRSEENFRRSLEDSPLGVRIVTAKGETIYANKVLLDIYGYANVEELNKIPLKERYTPQSYAESHIRIKSREEGDSRTNEYEINIVRKNGEIRHLLVLRKEVLWNGTGQFQVIYQDTTERKQAESEREDALAALRESEEKYRKIFEDHAAVKLLIEPENGAIIDANKAAEHYYGWTRAELKRMHIQQINILPAEKVKIEMEKVQQQKCVHFEFRHRRADGSIRDVEIFSSKIEMAGKDILHSIIHDITDRKLAEEALKESRDRFQLANLATFNPIWDWNLQTDTLWWNENFRLLFSYQANEIEPGIESWTSRIHPEDRERVGKGIHAAIDSGKESWSDQYHFRRKDGSYADIVDRGLIRCDSNGKPTRMIGAMEDITERKRAEEKIRNSLVEKELLLKEVHHRVNNNLMIIIGLIKMQEANDNNEIFNPLLQELEGRIRSMALAHECVYKSEDLAHVDLQNYIETMSGQIHVQLGTGHNIRFSVQAAGVNVDLDSAVPCGLILNELITNAYKHAFPDGRPSSGVGNCEINIIVNQEDGMNVLTVANNGVELPADLDLEKSETLGLRLIKMLSHQINGSIELDRSAGTVFRLKFPGGRPRR